MANQVDLQGTLAQLILVFLFAVPLLLSQPAQAQTFQVLYTFSGGIDWMGPYDLTLDHGGNLYGNTLGRFLPGRDRSTPPPMGAAREGNCPEGRVNSD